ncbi:MAG: HlyD family efflux transporter periplasmic adaptor subunit [Gammaproteobacteria bacterium]
MHAGRNIAMSALALVVLAALVFGFMPRPVPVDTATVRRGPLQVTVEEEGRTRVIDRYVLSAPVAGLARRIELDVGDQVNKGDVLLELEPMPAEVLDPRSRARAEARVQAASAARQGADQSVAAARADAEFADHELARKEQLRADGLISEDDLDRARARGRVTVANLRSAEFAVDVAQHELEAAKTALVYSTAAATGQALEMVPVSSPVAGRVLDLIRESEGVVSPGQPLVEIGDPAALEIEVDVLSADAVRITSGTEVEFHRWGGDAPLEGVVRVVEPRGFTKISALGVEEQRVLVISDIVSPRETWERLGDGYRVEAEFIIWQEPDVLKVPAGALFRMGDAWAVYIFDDGQAQLRQIGVGRRSGLEVQVLTGLESGQTVIVHPSDDVADGVRVRNR